MIEAIEFVGMRFKKRMAQNRFRRKIILLVIKAIDTAKVGDPTFRRNPSSAKKDNVLTLDEIIASVNKEDLLCIEIVEEIGQKLGRQIAGLISIFNPELVIIGGTLSSTGDYIVQPIKTAIRKYSLNLVNKDATVTVSKLKDKAGVVGACMLARSRMFEI